MSTHSCYLCEKEFEYHFNRDYVYKFCETCAPIMETEVYGHPNRIPGPNGFSAGYATQAAAAEERYRQMTGKVGTASVPGGMACSRCGDFNEYAAPNQPDGKFKCYGCRN